MMNKYAAEYNGIGFAFPIDNQTGGLTKREYFAAAAMQGILSGNHTFHLAETAKLSVDMADQLLLALEEEKIDE